MDFVPSLIGSLNSDPYGLNGANISPVNDVSPVDNQNSTNNGGDFFSTVTKGLLGLVDNGLGIWKQVNQLTNGAGSASNNQQQTTAKTPVAFGLTQTQIVWIGAGAGLLVLLVVLRRR